MKTIGILGSSGYIAKGLIYELSHRGYPLILLNRNPDNTINFIKEAFEDDYDFSNLHAEHIDNFYFYDYDVIVNCINAWNNIETLFTVTEFYDKLLISYVKNHPDCTYINFSSGAVYGNVDTHPVTQYSSSEIQINPIQPSDYYGINKLYQEAKHRNLWQYRIFDIRLFSYFSRFFDPSQSYFLNQIIYCVQNNLVFETGPDNFYRDYIGSEDLCSIVEKIIYTNYSNNCFDTYSKELIDKFGILDFFTNKYNLRYTIDHHFKETTSTNAKTYYYTTHRKLDWLEYEPEYTSLELIEKETAKIL